MPVQAGSEGIVLAELYDALLCDLDGVVYAGPEAIAGAIPALDQATRSGLKLGYVTNNASRSPQQVAAHLRELGAPAEPEQVFGSAQAGAELLAERLQRGATVLVVGAEALAAEVSALGFRALRERDLAEPPAAVIQGFSPDLGWRDLAEAAFAISDGALWIATNTDLTIPVARGVAPGNGTLVGAVAQATGRRPLVAGKPEAALFRLAAERLAARKPLVIGDRLDTDIRGGCNAGFSTALVLTGINDVASALAAAPEERPDYFLDSLEQIFDAAPRCEREGAGVRCGQARAEAAGDELLISAPAGSLDGRRAAAAAWWAEHPDHAAKPSIEWSS
ncbi:HAD-IIA family hydrolase [Acaricomes phytoseiuli]|uniref:HAD-IIA family hydrolase n=1 Tax=Acaricomes phytoseiuli TaxID=291968 RepID=UPI0003A7A431|nr:HAD-IIA family hydrolase [Acaricomes phytoseiuli]MCW1249436.1 HAD-IIA family hydrolase [Acaricomes phytoseiuli]